MKKAFAGLFPLLAAFIVMTACWSTAEALVIKAPIIGEIERLTLNDPTDVYSGGVMIVGGHEVILPKNLLIDLPANRLSLQQIFDQAPAGCRALGQSGLAKSDTCNASGTGGFATLSANRTNAGNVIAGDVLIEKGKENITGQVTYINYTDGYFRVGGIPGDANTGVMLRLNDPTSRHSVQQGAGCAGGPNCSPDPRFTLDPDNYVVAFSTGYPVCIPSTVARNFPGLPALPAAGIPAILAQSTQAAGDGSGDLLCPAANRTPAAVTEPPVNDSRLFAPLMVGDSVSAEGNFETINGARFVSVHTMRVNKALATKNLPGQPDYLFLEEVFIEAPGFQNQRARMLLIGYTTLSPTDVDFWSIHRDPATNQIHEFPLASIVGCDNASAAAGGGGGGGGGGGAAPFPNGNCSSQGLVGAGANIFRIRYDVDFLLAVNQGAKFPGGARGDLNPCLQLMSSPRFAVSNPGICQPGGATLANNFGIMSPIPHEIQARTGHRLDSPAGSLITLDIYGNQATNGQYLFPFGINLGGIELADFLEIDVNLLNTPVIFEGIPWNLDRRLSPSGCMKAGGCEPLGTSPIGTFALDPFPYSGLDPRLQAEFLVAGQAGGTPKGPYSDANFTASTLNTAFFGASNRVLSFVDSAVGKFNGNATVLPYVLGAFPADPPLFPINPTPVLAIFAPIAINDNATTDKNTLVSINLTGNDVAVMGAVDPATLQIVSSPANGGLSGIVGGSVTYTPNNNFTGQDTFTYKVASTAGGGAAGGYSNVATVTVSVVALPTAVADTATTFTGAPQMAINVIANDTPGSNPINPSSVNIVSPANCGTAALPNPGNGTLLFTPPNNAGTCTFSYTVSDSSTPPRISAVATVTVTVTPVNVNPVANPDTAFTTVGSMIAINVIANDTTTSALDPATVTTSGLTGGSVVTPVVNGIVQYTAPGAPGLYSFNYTVKDVNNLTSNTTIVAVTVASPPTAGADSSTMTGGAGTNTLIDILANDTAVAPATIVQATATIVTPPANGSAVVNPVDGKVTYSPNPGFVGVDTFTYSVKDSLSVVSNTATVTVTVNAPATESLTVTGAQYIVSTDTWQIDGTSTNQGGTIEIFNSPTVGTGPLGPSTQVTNGNWTFSVTGAGLPNAQLQISVRSTANPAVIQELIPLVVR